jgi:hypothetical protein
MIGFRYNGQVPDHQIRLLMHKNVQPVYRVDAPDRVVKR